MPKPVPSASAADPPRARRNDAAAGGAYQSARISLLVAILVAVMVFFGWRIWHTNGEPLAESRTLTDFELRWVCARGHHFVAPGRMTQMICPICGDTAEVADVYECPQHGPFEVQVRFAVSEQTGQAHAALVRGRQTEWTPVSEGVSCPRCGKPLQRAKSDPLAPYRKKSGG